MASFPIADMFLPQPSLDDTYNDDQDVLDEGILNDFSTPDFSAYDLNRPATKLMSNNPFIYSQDRSVPWDEASSVDTPVAAVYDGLSVEFDQASSASYSATQPDTPFDMMHTNHMAVYPPAPSTNASIPPSPHQSKDWMAAMAVDGLDEGPSVPKRMRQHSPRSNSPILRRDGIRKKNARFEIPAERNLTNIDNLIAQSADDQEIKELKQQKRLLRNRQAALDSRQRKKLHTERLEEEKKFYTEKISDLEDKVSTLEIRNQDHVSREDNWRSLQQQYEHFIENCRMEQEEMIRKHTLETADLRKKNAVLVEHLQKVETPAPSSASSTAFSTDFGDLDDSFLGENFSEFTFDEQPETTVSGTLVPARRPERVSVSDDDKPAASGVLLILLLCGAFVASKGSATAPSAIPRMPDDIREASATVLDNIFKDAGVQQAPAHLPTASLSRIESMEPAPSSHASWPSSSSTFVGLSGSSLDILNQQLVKPSKEQEAEQLFSLSADQYNGVTSQELHRAPETAPASQGRRNLGASLAAMRANGKPSVAEVYTRSLMWDKVPSEVVRDFAKLVAECNRQESPDDAD
ncbi:MAG: hypothetical protein M1814_004023 [Vezdaea aestivalis]|nr:MAG: hypothetical protein M1814_004023 [Vezdaea aestivalis]